MGCGLYTGIIKVGFVVGLHTGICHSENAAEVRRTAVASQ